MRVTGTKISAIAHLPGGRRIKLTCDETPDSIAVTHDHERRVYRLDRTISGDRVKHLFYVESSLKWPAHRWSGDPA